MASAEHLELATYVKGIHQHLREQTHKMGFEAAWREHCEQQDILKKYADSMSTLATKHWEPNSMDHADSCRISWTHHQCVEYFFNGGLVKQRQLEAHKLCSLGALVQPEVSELEPCSSFATKPLELLDVGSCYNPFSKFPVFRVTAIDIAPAEHANVKQCDFLQVQIIPQTLLNTDIYSESGPLLQLPEKYFNVIVFSLLLEYFPSPDLRFICCEKAYKLLKNEGLLIIITPDSKHSTANAKMIKKWKMALATLGFWRAGYEKLKHVHCMVFRKSVNATFPKLWAEKESAKYNCDIKIDEPSTLFVIPQDRAREIDSNTAITESSNSELKDPLVLAKLFDELPEFSLEIVDT